MNEQKNDRLKDLKRFYDLLAHLEYKNDTKLIFGSCRGKMNWPKQGVYFFSKTLNLGPNQEMAAKL